VGGGGGYFYEMRSFGPNLGEYIRENSIALFRKKLRG